MSRFPISMPIGPSQRAYITEDEFIAVSNMADRDPAIQFELDEAVWPSHEWRSARPTVEMWIPDAFVLIAKLAVLVTGRPETQLLSADIGIQYLKSRSLIEDDF